MKRLLGTAAFLLPLTFVLGACGDGTGSETGSISLLLTDAPGDVKAAWVTIDRIYLQPGSEPDGDGPADGNLLPGDQPITVDLVALGDQVVEIVNDEPVDVGFYRELRMVVTEACIAVETLDGYDYYSTTSWQPDVDDPFDGFDSLADPAGCLEADHLQTPSYAQSGLKVKLPHGGMELTTEQKILLLDFDAGESFIDQSGGHIAGGSGKWVMHPVVHAMDVGTSASITVNLSAPQNYEFPTVGEGENAVVLGLGDFTVRAFTGDPLVPTDEGYYVDTGIFTDPDENGVFSATLFVMPSDVPYVIEPLLTGFLPAFLETIEPVLLDEEGETYVLDLTLDSTDPAP